MTGTVWAAAEARAGMSAQVLGLGEALGGTLRHIELAPRAGFAWTQPLLPLPRSLRLANADAFRPPWPDVLIVCGRQALRLAPELKHASGGHCYTVCLQDPRAPLGWFDLVVAPAHDGLAGPNVVTTLGALNRITPARLDAAVAQGHAPPPGQPRLAVLIGGDSRHHRLTAERAGEIGGDLARLARGGASVWVTTSRRTSPEALAALGAALAGSPARLWDGRGENPLFAMLGAADAIAVTADSTNMLTEAATTGKPVHLLPVAGGAPKFDALIAALRNHGALRPFSGGLTHWTYARLDETARIAALVRARAGHDTTA